VLCFYVANCVLLTVVSGVSRVQKFCRAFSMAGLYFGAFGLTLVAQYKLRLNSAKPMLLDLPMGLTGYGRSACRTLTGSQRMKADVLSRARWSRRNRETQSEFSGPSTPANLLAEFAAGCIIARRLRNWAPLSRTLTEAPSPNVPGPRVACPCGVCSQ
jgi:hypothetical protein